MSFEKRTRILLLLPIPKTLPQFYAVLNILDGLRRTSGGITRTDYYTPVVWGKWFDDIGMVEVEDDLVLIISDDVSAANDPNLEAHLIQIKLYAQFALGQDIVWITIHEVQRLDAHDYVK